MYYAMKGLSDDGEIGSAVASLKPAQIGAAAGGTASLIGTAVTGVQSLFGGKPKKTKKSPAEMAKLTAPLDPSGGSSSPSWLVPALIGIGVLGVAGLGVFALLAATGGKSKKQQPITVVIPPFPASSPASTGAKS